MTQRRVFAALILGVIGWLALSVYFGQVGFILPIMLGATVIAVYVGCKFLWVVAGDIANSYNRSRSWRNM